MAEQHFQQKLSFFEKAGYAVITNTLLMDNAAGTLVGMLNVKSTGGLDKWETQSCAVSGANGVHDLILKFTGGSEPGLNFDWWKFESTTTDK
jgi:hypothetical protein